MKKMTFTFLVMAVHAITPSLAQTALKMGTTGGPAGNGPVTTAQSVTLIDAGTGTAYSPAVTATYSLSNQQFGPGLVEGMPAASAINFAGDPNGTANTPILASALYELMNAFGGASNAMFTACNSCTAGAGVIATTNTGAISFFNCTDALISSNTVNLQALNARVYYGDLTISFNRPVSNPVLQIVGVGGQRSSTIGGINYDLGFTTEFDLVGTAVTLVRLSGNTAFTVSSTQITNTATWYGNSSAGAVLNGVTRFSASGSVVARGTNISSITLRMYMRGDGGRISNASGTVVPAGTANGNTVYPAWSLGATNPWAVASTTVAGDGLLIGVSMQRPIVISGSVFNDPNGGNVNNSTGTTNAVPAGMFANLLDAAGNVVTSVSIPTTGAYSFPAIFEGNSYSIQVSTGAGTQGAPPPPLVLPTGWVATGEFTGTPNTGSDGTINSTSAAFTAGTADIVNVNFGMQRTPESAVNAQTVGNPAGNVNVTVLPAWFTTSNVGANPNTLDYDGGTVNSIRITGFPTNTTSITINGIQYTSGTWPAGGVTIPYTPGIGPTQPILIDPVNGSTGTAVIPFVSIDNAGAADPTPGSVTLQLFIILPVKLESFTVVKDGSTAIVKWQVSEELNLAGYEIEFSTDGVSYNPIGAIAATNAGSYFFTHNSPVKGINYYRLKSNDRDGRSARSDVRIVTFGRDGAITVYPNPASDVVNILFSRDLRNKPVTVRILAADGRLVMTQQLLPQGQRVTVNTSNLTTGRYVVHTQTGDEESGTIIEVIR